MLSPVSFSHTLLLAIADFLNRLACPERLLMHLGDHCRQRSWYPEGLQLGSCANGGREGRLREGTGGNKRECVLVQLEEANKRDTEVARELIAAKRKDRALLVLKMKRLREQQLQTAENYLLNVQQVRVCRASQHASLELRGALPCASVGPPP